MRLEGKKAVVFGAGQTPGQSIGNGRATAETLAREETAQAAAEVIHLLAEPRPGGN